jgi:GT2 family glycosyltransferase
MTRELRFSVILPVCHGGRFLRNVLASAQAIDSPPDCFEVVVAGAEDDSQTIQIVQEASAAAEFDLRYVGCHSANRSARLNAACATARGDILVFADDDCVLLPDWLAQLDAVLQGEQDVGVVGGSEELSSEQTTFGLALDWVLSSFVGTGGVRKGTGPAVSGYYPKLWNMAVPREVALGVASPAGEDVLQVFNESLGVHEDVDLAKRAAQSGRRIVFAPQMRVKHCRDTTFRDFVRRNFSMARTCRSLRVHRLPHVMLAACLLALVALGALAVFSPAAWTALCICAAAYALVLISSGLSATWTTGKLGTLALVPLLLAGLHVARGLGYLFPWRVTNLEEMRP